MPLEDLALYAIGLILLIGAIGAGLFIALEVMSLLRDIFRDRRREDNGGAAVSPQRRIKPFRDKGTVERLIAYFKRPDKK
jgi:hypothetical protein